MGTVREGQQVSEQSGNHHAVPPKGPQADRDDVTPPTKYGRIRMPTKNHKPLSRCCLL